jgi:hypothetical protein
MMTIFNRNDVQEQLEDIVDQTSLGDVLDMLSAICFEKATHVDEAWQDRVLARAWEKNGQLIDKAATRVVATA